MYAYGACVSPADPFLSLYKYMMNKDYSATEKTPRLIFTILNGGKALNSKVKFSKFYLILDITPLDEVDAGEIFFKIQ